MKAFSKLGLLLSVALLASAVMAISAQAVVITPDSTAVKGTASTDPQLTVGGTTVTCLDGTAEGTTGAAPGSPTINTLSVTFQNSCTIGGLISATVTCAGTITLTATSATGGGNGKGTVELTDDFTCTISAASCVIVVTGPQDPTNVNSYTAGATDTLFANVTVTADVTQTGFGCPTGTNLAASFSADYKITPNNVTIDAS